MAEQAPRHYVLELPGLPLSANARRRSPWPVVYRDGQAFKQTAALMARAAHHGPPLERVRVVATLVRRAGPPLDPDGAPVRCKEILDGLVAGGMLEDDSPAHLLLEVAQECCGKSGAKGVRLEITEVLCDAD